jgi:hypothetical protein
VIETLGEHADVLVMQRHPILGPLAVEERIRITTATFTHVLPTSELALRATEANFHLITVTNVDLDVVRNEAVLV